MKNFFKKYLWVFEFLGVAIILALGILAFIKHDDVFFYVIGIALIVFGVFRIFPLLKTTKDKLMKLIYAIEIVLNIIAGLVLILNAGKGNDSLIRNIVGGVFYLKGAVYFYATSIRKEATDYPKFFTHLVLITLGLIIVFTKYFTNENLGWVVLIIAILSALFISISGYKNYKNYRYEQLAKEETKKVVVRKEENINKKEDPAPVKPAVVVPEEEKHEEIRA